MPLRNLFSGWATLNLFEKLERASALFLLLSIAMLPFRLGGTLESPTVKPSEVLLAIATALLLPVLMQRKLLPEVKKMGALKNAIVVCAALFTTFIIGTATSFFVFRRLPFPLVPLEYVRLIVVGCFFLLAIYHSGRIKIFPNILFASFATSIIPAILGLYPGRSGLITIFSGGGSRLAGFLSDPNYFANLSIIALAFFFSVALSGDLTIAKRIPAAIGTIGMMSAIWQSGSRSGWLGAIACIGVCSLVTIVRSDKKMKAAGIAALFALTIVAGGFLVLGGEQKTNTFARTGYFVNFTNHESSASQEAIADMRNAIETREAHLDQGQDRLDLWSRALPFVSANPLGYGPGYYRIANIYNAGGAQQVVHSLPLEMLLTGGVLGGLIFIALLGLCAREIMKSREPLAMGIAGALVGILVSALFLDALSLRWLWVLMAIALSLNVYQGSQEATKDA
jgi:hypothetical protein